ncbi:hypothetical protein GF389_05490 [Candidatus Dojkabacteria bacterium]|nr:hypothetical protein [Candidatus Dojkabacteria bacterium]
MHHFGDIICTNNMILSKNGIEKEIGKGNLSIEPNPIIKEASVKVHLSNLYGKNMEKFEEIDSYVLKPKGFILAKAKEILTLPDDIAAFYDGYIGVATKGLLTHGSSMFIDPGGKWQITLEIFNASEKDIVLKNGMRVGQYIFMRIEK